jgi:hypothetical protein
LPEAKALFHRILRKTKECYGFEMRGLRLEGAREVDWTGVEKSAKTKIPAAIAYTLPWGGPRSDGMTITTSFSAKNASKPAPPPG